MNVHKLNFGMIRSTEVKSKNPSPDRKLDISINEDKEVVFEKTIVEESVEGYGKDAEVKHAVNKGAVEDMKKALDQKMENSFLQMAIDVLGDQQVGLKAALEDILSNRGGEITSEMIEEAKADVAEDGFFGIEATANRLVEFAKTLSGGNPEKADLLKDTFLEGFSLATEAWGDELPEITQKTKERTIELFEEWKNGGEESISEIPPEEVAVENDQPVA